MKSEARNPNDETKAVHSGVSSFGLRHSSFIRGFEFRHSSFAAVRLATWRFPHSAAILPCMNCTFDGVINVDKPAGMSSAAVVARVKRLLPRGTKIGHAGTLDPFATGVLLLLVGRATKSCERLMDQPKQYETTVKLGATTATDDPESPEQPRDVSIPVMRDQIDRLLPRFIGEIQQRPPAFSAMKVGGRRAYELARKGHEVLMEPRPVHVYGIEVADYTWPLLRLRIDCGRGTYIRAVARDIGEALNVGGYLTQLRRTRVGAFHVEAAIALDRLSATCIADALVPPPADF
jgi:tRNA pseudouridine55 synthase